MSFFSQADILSLGLMLAMLFVAGWLLFRAHRKLGPRGKPAAGSIGRPASERLAVPFAAAPPEARQWEVEMHETARELKAEIDSKISALEHLVNMAEGAESRLEKLLERAEAILARSPGDADSSPAAAAHAFMNGEAAGISERTGPPATQQSEHPQVQRADRPPSRDADAAPSARPNREGRYDEIYALSDAGMDHASIARQVNSTKGEVELILSLRGRG